MMKVKKDVVHFQQPDIMDVKILNPTKIDVKVTETVQINRKKSQLQKLEVDLIQLVGDLYFVENKVQRKGH